MANKGETKCLKINNASAITDVKKTKRFVYRPKPGKHTGKTTISIGFVLKNLLNLADNTREVKYIINNRELVVDKRQVKDHRLPVGMFDIIEIPKLNKAYKIYYGFNGAYYLKEVEKSDAKFKICKIISKKITSKNNIQLVTNDGRVLITTNLAYKPKATIKLDLEENVIKEYYPLEVGREVFVIGGKHIGSVAKIEEIKLSTMTRPMLIKLKQDGVDFETIEKNIIVIN